MENSPSKVRESGMPEREYWKSFFEPEKILQQLLLTPSCHDVIEFGCGYGTFTFPAAKVVGGTVFTQDIDPKMLDSTQQRSKRLKQDNVKIEFRDFIGEGSGLADQSVDYAMLFNILHVENPISLLLETYRNLTDDGLLGIIHWNHNEETPRGPPLKIRPNPHNNDMQSDLANARPLMARR